MTLQGRLVNTSNGDPFDHIDPYRSCQETWSARGTFLLTLLMPRGPLCPS